MGQGALRDVYSELLRIREQARAQLSQQEDPQIWAQLDEAEIMLQLQERFHPDCKTSPLLPPPPRPRPP